PRKAEAGLRAAVLVASDSAAAGTRDDKSGTIIRDRLSEAGFSVTEVIVVRDDAKAIAELLQQQIAENINLVLTTGGTGLGPRDVIVEATRQVVTREAPGIAEALRSYGQKRTPFAMISQGIAGIA